MRLPLLLLLLGSMVPGSLPAAGQEASTVASPPRQTLQAGDVIRLRIWREPDMSGEFVVDSDGRVIFPRVGEYFVFDDTADSLTERLLVDYRVYLRNPSIEITVLRRIRIIGAVNNPGLYLLDPTVTVSDALAQAGGATPLGDPNRLRVIRNGVETALTVGQDTELGDSAIRSGDQLFVPERSWISRNSGIVAATVSGLVSLTIALFIR